MEEVTKTFESNIIYNNREIHVRGSIISLPEDVVVENIDSEENEGFIFLVTVAFEPVLPENEFNVNDTLIYVLHNGGNTDFGYLQNNRLVELEEGFLKNWLQANIFNVLAVPGNDGHFRL